MERLEWGVKFSICISENAELMIIPQAFPAWRDTTAKYRSDLLRRWFNLCKENEDDLAEILQIEQGKPIREAKGEVAYGSTFLEWFSEECRRINGEVSVCLD